MIALRSVVKEYDLGTHALRVLKDVCLDIPTGQYVSLVGKSGSGKSTLLHLCGGLDRPTSGSIRIDGQDLTTLTDAGLTLVRRRKIGFIFQFFNLMPNLSVLENVTLPALLDGKRLEQVRDRAVFLLEAVGLAHRYDHRPDQLSGGEMQRAAIARALLTDPALILADEPTGNLDSKTGQEILALIRRAHEEFGKTILLVTHDPKAAEQAERRLTLSDGQVLLDEMLRDGVSQSVEGAENHR